MSKGKPCGQRKPIWVSIREILEHRYHDGSQFRESVQNADDAGAGTVNFIMDNTAYKSTQEEGILTPLFSKEYNKSI